MKEKIRRVLAQRERKTTTHHGLAPAAVLLPLYEDQGQYHILFTKRTETVEHHKGQVSFPGGAYDEDDENLLATALRETFEEIGVRPEDVEILGELDEMRTFTSNYAISPFVAVIPYPYQFKVNHEEVERLIEIPLRALLDETRVREETVTYEGEPYPSYYYEYEEGVVWGATARILKQFLDLIS